MKKALLLLAIAVSARLCSAAIINIPADYPTIQQGIDASSDGDTVLVQPGLYIENIVFNGHNIILGSLFLTTGDDSYISSTVIDGDSSGLVVSFHNHEDSTAMLKGFTIMRGNAQEGGGISCIESNPVIANNIITLNLSSFYGGGIFCYYANPVISCNEIYNNTVLLQFGRGGGIYCGSSNPLVYNNVIHHNTSAGMGGGVSCNAGDPILINNILFGNIAGGGGGIYCWVGNPVITNCILWGDLPTEIHMAGGSVPDVTYCNMDSYWPGTGNIRVYPDFRDSGNNDFHLMSTACGDSVDSPCIDAGDPDIIDSLLDCNWGLGGVSSDMGAYGGGDSLISSVIRNQTTPPGKFVLLRNYPNPFNAATSIEYTLFEKSRISIAIYNILGREVAMLFEEEKQPGAYSVRWKAGDHPSGVYFARLKTRSLTKSIKMILLK